MALLQSLGYNYEVYGTTFHEDPIRVTIVLAVRTIEAELSASQEPGTV